MSHLQSSPAIKNPHDRIRNHSPKAFNKKIDSSTDYMIKTTIDKGAFAIRARLLQLDKEWDIDRAFTAILSGAVCANLALTLRKKNTKFAWLPFLQAGFALMYSTYGWSPTCQLLRALGFRTRYEIQAEREELLNALINMESEFPGKKFTVSEWDIYGSI